MNKKVSIIVTFILCLISIMGIAVWGTLPEDNNPIRATLIQIPEYDQTNEDNDKFKDIMDIVTLQNNTYEITYEVVPGDAYVNIQVRSSISSVRVQVDSELQIVYVFFDPEDLGKTVTIRIWDTLTQKGDEITLWFKQPGSVVVPDIN